MARVKAHWRAIYTPDGRLRDGFDDSGGSSSGSSSGGDESTRGYHGVRQTETSSSSSKRKRAELRKEVRRNGLMEHKGKGKGKMEVSAEERPSKKRKTMIITLKEESQKERGEESPKDSSGDSGRKKGEEKGTLRIGIFFVSQREAKWRD